MTFKLILIGDYNDNVYFIKARDRVELLDIIRRDDYLIKLKVSDSPSMSDAYDLLINVGNLKAVEVKEVKE